MGEPRLAPEQGEQTLALLFRRDRFPRAADGQHAIVATFILQAFSEEASQDRRR